MSSFHNNRLDPATFSAAASQKATLLVAEGLANYFGAILKGDSNPREPILPPALQPLVARDICNKLTMTVGSSLLDERACGARQDVPHVLKDSQELANWTHGMRLLAAHINWQQECAQPFSSLLWYSTKIALRRECSTAAYSLAAELLEAAELDEAPRRRIRTCICAASLMVSLAEREKGAEHIITLRSAMRLLPFYVEHGYRQKTFQLYHFANELSYLEDDDARSHDLKKYLSHVRYWLTEPIPPNKAARIHFEQGEALFHADGQSPTKCAESISHFIRALSKLSWRNPSEHILSREVDAPFAALLLLRVAQCFHNDPEHSKALAAAENGPITFGYLLEAVSLPLRAVEILKATGFQDSRVMNLLLEFQDEYFKS